MADASEQQRADRAAAARAHYDEVVTGGLDPAQDLVRGVAVADHRVDRNAFRYTRRRLREQRLRLLLAFG